MRARTMSTPRAGAFARTGNVNKSSDGSAACGASLRDTLLGEMVRPCNAAAVRFRKPDSTIANEKTRGQFPGAGFCNFCDDGDMPVICPTCQTFFGRTHAVCRHAWRRHQPTIDTDPRPALPPNQPRLHRVIAIEPAQLVLLLR